jgi:hypothetical protein
MDQYPVLLRYRDGHRRELTLSDPGADRDRRALVSSLEKRGRIDEDDLGLLVVDIFLALRDQFEARIVSSDAAGFSHGFWSFE